MRPDPLAKGNCNNPFLEADGFCTKCAGNHLQGRKKRGKASTTAAWQAHIGKAKGLAAKAQLTIPLSPEPKVRKARKAQPAIAKSELVQAAIEMVELVAELYGVDIEVNINTRKQGGRARYLPSGYVIEFSPKTIAWFSRNGYQSYRVGCTNTARSVLGKVATGKDAVRVHALHEVAHILVYEDGYDTTNRPHGKYFLGKFAELINVAM